MRKIPTLQSLFQRQTLRKRLRNRSVFRKLLGIETLESRALLASDTIQINSLSDLAAYYTAGTNSYSIGDESTSSVTIADGIVIDTSTVVGLAGSITIQGDEISIGNNVQITANGPLNTATGVEQDGAIKLLSENVLKGYNNSAVMQIEDIVRAFQGQKSTITVGTSTVIEGGAITISTDSGNELVGDFIASQVHLASKVFLEAFEKPKPDLLALPITAQVWEPVSEITIGEKTSIQSSSEVSLSATATANAFGKAVWNTLTEKTGKSPFGFALGEFVNIAKATIDVSSDATISAEGDIEINTKVDNVAELEVATIENLGITQTNPKSVSFAYGSTEVISKSTILLDVGSQVVSSGGNVTIEAEATDENSVSSKATSYRDGFVAIGGAFAYSKATVTVDVKGTVTSGIVETETSSPENLIFNPAFVVDFATNSLVFDEDVPYSTGDQVLFNSPDGSTIPGLVPGTVYYAIVDTTNPKSLQLSLTSAGAMNGTEIPWAVSYPTLTVGGYPLPITVVDSVYSNTILFTYDTLPDTTTAVFTDGQLVTYSPVTGQFLGANDASGNLLGALPAGLYAIKIATSPQPSLYPLAIQLVDQAGLIGPSGNVVVLNTNSFFTTASGTIVQVASTDLQLSQITLNFSTLSDSQDGQAPLPTPPAQTPTQSALFTNAQPLVFTSGLGNQIANLTNAASYWAVVDSSTPGVIRLASNYEQSVAANPSVQNFVPELKTVSNQAAVQSVTNSFTDVNFVTTYTLQTNNAYSIWNNADGGTFTITLLGPDGAVTTTALAWNVSSADLQSALNSLSGIVSTVSGQGTQLAPWIVSILFQFEIGTVEPGTGLVFTNDPNIADGTAVIYLGNAAKPIEGLTVGSTYYAYNGTNPSFDTDIPQYVLNLRTTQDTTAPVIQYELVQSMTDSQGDQYSFLSSIASQNLLTLNLPSSVVIEPIDGSALTGGTLTSLTLAANTATTLYSFATSGTFTLIATDAQGTTQTTSSLAYNASAIEVETALNALGILPVQVTGLGTMASPWTVVGLTDQTLTADNSLLRNGTFVASILIDELVVDTQQIWTEATGGTFVLNLTAGGQMFTTAAIAWNATASQVIDSIEQAQVINNVPVVRAVVTGTGTEADPWQISMWYQSIQTGDALTFNDSWLLNSLGMVNGQTYYAVVSTSQLTASGVTLSLALSLADATASTPDVIDMQEYLLLTASSTGSMVGSQMGIGLVPKDSGVTIRATLDASDSASMATSIGLFPMLGFYLKTLKGDNKIEDGKWVSGIEKEIEEKLPKEKIADTAADKHIQQHHGDGNIDGTNPFEISLGFALIVSENVVAVTIGSDAVIESQGSVTIESGIGHVLHSFASAGTARTTASEEAKGNKALGVGLAMTFVDNTSNAFIESNAQVSGATGVSIKSKIEYPFAWKQTAISTVHNDDLGDSWKSKGDAGTQIAENVVINALFSNAFGVSNWLFNDSTNVDAMSGDTDESKLDFALSGSLLIKNITNNNVAQIFDGAKINQSPNVLASGEQGLKIVAETKIDQVSMAGQMILGLNFGWLYYASKTKGGLGENSNFLLGLTDAKNNIGGSFNFSDLNNTTQAIIGGTSTATDAAAPSGPTRIDFGNDVESDGENDGLVLESLTKVEFIPLAQSGGISTGFGLEASLVDVNVHKQTTQSAILDATLAPVITADETTTGETGEIKLTADDQSILTPSAGGLFIGGSVNIGFSSAIAVLNRDVQAFIGQELTSDTTPAPAQSTWATIESLGSVVIDASASGKIIPISIAGSVSKKKSEEKGQVVPDDQKDPVHFGFGVSGSYSEAKITDTVQAYLNGVVLDNKVSPLEIKSLEIQATNSTQTDLATGAAAFQREDGKNSGVGIAGAGSALIYASTVQAIVSNADLTAYELSLNSKNNKDLGTFAAGLDGASVAAAAIEVAGSVAINHITNVTKSEILNSTGSEIGTITLSALENDDVVSAAGTLTIVTSLGSSSLGQDEGKSKVKVGFGFGFSQNLLDSTTYATISEADLNQTEGAVSLQSEQASRSFVLAAGAVFEVGQGTGIAAYGMVALNEYTTADVQATVAGSTISSSSVASTTDDTTVGMSVVSTLVPIMITAAGDLGLGIAYKTGPGATEASIGAGVSVTEVSITGNSLATISDSTITLDQGNLVVDAFTGQATDYSELDDTLTEINLPLGKYNLFSLAIAGGLSTAVSAEGGMALGINGVGAGIGSTTSITTQAGISSDSTIELQDNSAAGGALSITALENLNIYNDAGGASVSFAVTDGDTSFGVAVGIGAAVHTNTNKVIASLEDSTATVMGGLTIDSQSESEVTSIGFGVALDVSVAGLTGVSIAASSAVAKMDSTQTISAYLSGGRTAVGDDSADDLTVTALDKSEFYTAVGSGSLAGSASGGAGVALAAGTSVSRIEPTHTISAYIGDSTTPTQTTTVMAQGTVVVQATNDQTLTADAIAVASSVSLGTEASGSFAAAGASSRITTANSITAGLYAGTGLTSTLQGAAGNAISIQSTDSATINSTVGSAAAAFSISPIPVGASLGISISEITNNNVSQSLINSATIATAGGDILVQTTGSNNHSSKSVATSLTDGLGVAGAGGNSNIYDYAKFTASVEGATSINTTLVGTGSNPPVVGDLSVLANSKETILAEVFGGAADLGIGSVGVFISNATRSGATQANLVTEGLISVGNLNVKATTDQTITSDGMSVTIGLLAGSGETHNLLVDEEVGVSLSGSTATPVTPWSVSGNLTLDATSQNLAVAKTSGAGNGQQGVNIALLGAGSFKVVSEVSPVVGVSVSNVTIAVTGASLMTAVADSQNQANTRSGSGSLVGANAAIAQTVNDPTISLTTSALNLTADSATFQIENDLSYETSTNSIYATLIGGSGATATNNSTPTQTITLGQGTVIATTGSVVLSSVGTMLGAGGGDSSNASGFMANVGGGGGLIGGFGALSTSNMTSTSTITLDDDVSIVASDNGDIQIGAQSDWSINQFTHMSTGSSISGDGIASNIESKLGTAIQIGEGVQLKALEGQVEIGTAIRSLTSADSYSRTFGLAGGVSGNVDNQTTATQSVTVGQDATLTGGEGVTVTAGFNPLLQTGTQNDAYAIVTTRVMGLLDFPTNNYESDLAANNTVNVGSGTNIISGRDVQIGSVPGINSAVAYSFHNIDGGKGKTDTVTNGVTASNVVTLDGTIVAGQDHELAINIQESGNSFTMAINGGSPQAFPVSGNGSLQTVSPTANQTFVPFQVAVNDAYDPAELLVGLDPTVQDVLSLSLSSTPVSAITLQGLEAVGGRVLIQAGSLNGTGTVSAYSPAISLVNQSDAYLLLESLTIPQTYGMGQIDLTGGATLPGTLIFQSVAGAPTVLVSMTGTGPVGNNASGPALGLLGNITNTDGTVSISNAEGAFVQSGTILAESVTIDVPNASYIVNTPAAYFGTSGDIQDYWGNSTNLIPDGNFEYSQWSSESGNYLYNPTQLGWTFSGAGITGNNSGFTNGNPGAPIGSQVAFVQTKGTITRELAGLIPGSSYQLDLYAAQRAGDSDQTLSLSVGSLFIGTVTPSGTSYQSFSLPFVAPNPETTPVANTSMLTLSTGETDTATAAWNPDLISIPSSGTLTFEFTYQASGNKGADGVAMVFQNQGGYALGQTGGNLGYVGILGDTAAYQINLYNGHTQGSNFVTTNSAGTYLATGGVNFSSGNPIQVTLVYDADAQTVTESLSDPIANATFTRTYTGVNLASVLGTTATFGFTGGEGSVTSIQTISNFTMTNSTTNSITGFAGWGYVTPLTLTITGLNPGGTDETAFIDGLILSQNATGFTPGLNWYSTYSSTAGAYSANVAASSAANALYGSASKASSSIGFSNYLYNNLQTGISNFTNANVSVGNVGSSYPSSASKNWNTRESGQGVMFFGSQIPYLTGTPLSAGISSGSNYLTSNSCVSSTGYLDSLSNAQTYSPMASGNPNDSGLNVTQGTGPQNCTNAAARGIFPMVPYNVNGTVPTQATVASPQSRTLGGSITAGNISVTALYIDINGPINVGSVTTPISVILGSNLQTIITQFQTAFDAGTQLNPELSIDSYLGDSGLTGFYDAQLQQLFLEPYSINAGNVAAVFNGGILSTTSAGKISMISNPNAISIVNQTNIPMVLQGIAASVTAATGIVEFQDTFSNTSTVYVYTANSSEIAIYTGAYGATRDEMTDTGTTPGVTISHALEPNLSYQWTQSAYISRNLSFSQNTTNGQYALYGSTVNDSWSWGALNSSGTAPSNYGLASNPFASDQLILTDGVTSTALAVWNQEKIPLTTSGTLTVQFDYQAGGNKAADGVTFAFQNEGPTAVGGDGGALGYVGITGATAAYQINIYNGHTIGSNFVTTNTSGSYLTTGDVAFNSGNVIQVKLEFDGNSQTLTENLTDTVTGATFSRTYSNINLATLLEGSAYIGFTGGDGGATSIQTVSAFSCSNESPGFDGFLVQGGTTSVVLGQQTGTEYSQSLTAEITQSESAQSSFPSSNSSAWNYGPNSIWSWQYPTEILLQLKNQLPASNPIAIDFSGIKTGSLSVQSTASSLYVNGNIQFPGSVQLVGSQGIFASASGLIEAQSVQLESSSGSIGTSTAPISIGGSTQVNASSSSSTGVYLSSPSNLIVGSIQSTKGPVVLQTTGNIQGVAGSTTPSVMGTNIQLTASNGSIGTQAAPLVIQTQTSQLDTGTIVDGLLTASALNSIYVLQPSGELRLASVVTTAPLGVVSIVNTTGDITDGLRQDAFGLNDSKLSSDSVSHLVNAIKRQATDSVTTTVDAFEGSVDASYRSYWNIVGNSTNSDGSLELTEQGIELYQTQANAYYALPAMSGFVGWEGVGSNANAALRTKLTLSNGTSNSATAVWNPTELAIPSTGSFELSFVYQTTGSGLDYGITLAFQTQGVGAVGGAGTGLGYVGIAGPTAAYQIYANNQSGNTPGSNFVLTNTSGTYLPTGSVNFSSGHPILVQLVYDAEANTLTETLQDTVSLSTFTRVYSAVDLSSLLGAKAYIGFTGSDGQGTSTQTVAGFTLAGVATPAQVQSYVDGLYANAVEVFEGELVFGPDWADLPQFSAYDPTYAFTLSSSAQSQLTEGALTVTNLYALLSLEALSPKGTQQLGSNVEPVISTSVLFLSAGGSIGLYQDPVEIDLGDIQTGNLTAFQKELLAGATSAGELQFVGTNAAGSRVVYSYGDEPQGVTPTAVIVKIARALNVDVSASGIAMLEASESINLTETSGSMNVLYATGGKTSPVTLEAQSGLLPAILQASTSDVGWSRNGTGTLGYTGTSSAWTPTSMTLSSAPSSGISANGLSLTAGGSIGSSEQSLTFSATGSVNVFSLGSVWLQSDSPIQVREWTVKDALNLNVVGPNTTTDALAGTRSSFEGFESDTAGWNAASLNGNASVATPANGSEVLTLSTNANPNATTPVLGYGQASYTKNATVSFGEKFLIGFLYQSAGVGGRVALNLGNANQTGMALVLNLGGAGGTGEWADFVDTAEIGTASQGQSLGSVDLNSNHPILVVWSYDTISQIATATFTDTVTSQTATISQSGVKWFQLLGSRSAQMSWQALGDGTTNLTQSISEFQLIDGPVNMTSGSLDVQTGGNFGQPSSVDLQQFDNWITAGTGAKISSNSLTLTDGNGGEANAFWYPNRLDLVSTASFTVEFSYTAGGAKQADGITFALQTEGTSALGATGGSLGYTGISGPTAAYQINLYNGHVQGSNFVVNNTTGTYLTTGEVSFNSGHAIQVQLVFDADSNTVTENLTDTVTGATFTRSYSNIDLSKLFGANVFIGFTGGDGGATSIQTVSNFSLKSQTTVPVAQPILMLINGEVQISANVSIVAEQVLGDVEVGTISSQSSIDLTAPFGAVVSYQAPSNTGSSGDGEPSRVGLVAPAVTITALQGIGVSSKPLEVFADRLSGGTRLNDMVIRHDAFSGDTTASILKLIAGGVIQFTSNSHLSVDGQVVAQNALFRSAVANRDLELAIGQLSHSLGGSLPITLGGFANLKINDVANGLGRSIQVAQGLLDTQTSKVTLGDIRQLTMSLGGGNDSVNVQDASGLKSLGIDGNEGADRYSLGRDAWKIPSMNINGQAGVDALLVDLRSLGAWVTADSISTATGTIQHTGIENRNLSNLEDDLGVGSLPSISLLQEDFPANRLLILGTSGADSVAMTAQATGWRINTVWNGQTTERRTFASGQISDVQLFTLGGSDFVTILGSASLLLNLQTGRDDDWINVQSASATITDPHGNNFISTDGGDDTIHTGAGDDEIDAGGGRNKITDDGGLNTIFTGDQNDQIYHANSDDTILAAGGINDIWLNGVHQGWSNPRLPMDVNRDGQISPLDALILINEINKGGSGRMLGSPDSVSYYLDPDNDGFLAPLDVLVLVNWLNRSNGGGSGESDWDQATANSFDAGAYEQQRNVDAYFAGYEEDTQPESLKRTRQKNTRRSAS